MTIKELRPWTDSPDEQYTKVLEQLDIAREALVCVNQGIHLLNDKSVLSDLTSHIIFANHGVSKIRERIKKLVTETGTDSVFKDLRQ